MWTVLEMNTNNKEDKIERQTNVQEKINLFIRGKKGELCSLAQLRESFKHTQKFIYINRHYDFNGASAWVSLQHHPEQKEALHCQVLHKAQMFISQTLSGLTSASRTKLLWSLHMCVSLQQAASETWGMLQYWRQEVPDDEGRTKASVLS